MSGAEERAATGVLDPYVPRGVMRHLATAPDALVRVVDGSMVLCDVSGFTQLSERLQRRGREGAELLVGAINACFNELLDVAHANGGSLVKFGGDALLLFFDGDLHAQRACRSAIGIRRRLRTVGRVEAGGTRVNLRMTVGVHTGSYHFFLVGESHREHLVAGPGVTEVVRTEAAAATGQIAISRATAAQLPRRCLGAEVGGGLLLTRSPLAHDHAPEEPPYRPTDAQVAGTLSTAVRAHVTGSVAQHEHRTATVAFLQFSGTDAIVRDEGADACAAAVEAVVRDAQRAADEWEVCFLASDVDADGGKLLLCAGAPRVIGDDDARMLLALRQILDADRRLPVRVGVNRGPAFTGDIGPPYRRTYVVMGDTTNLAARLQAKARPGHIYATTAVLDCSTTRFEVERLEPFMAKGKARPVQAWSVGPPRRRGAADAGRAAALSLIGRDAELTAIDAAIAAVRAGRGRLIEIAGEAGIGKGRLVEEIRRRAPESPVVRVACEAYTSTVPYAAWHAPLRELLGSGADVVDELRAHARAAGVEAWLPLIATTMDLEVPSTPEVDALGADFRRAQLHAAMLALLRPHLDRPLLWEIDHVHAIDEASLALLRALVEELDATRWLIVATRRGAGPSFASGGGGQVVSLALEPLSAADATRLAHAATDERPLPPHLVALAVERAAGVPQFLLDLLQAARSTAEGELPESAELAAMGRIDALDPSDRSLVRRASVLGVSFYEHELQDVLAADSAALDEGRWDRLGGIFERDGAGHVRFRRPALRDAAYASLPFRIRRELHRAVADALERDGGTADHADPAALSLHLTLAGDYAAGYQLALVAARRAAEWAAPADAARLFRRAIEAGRAAGQPAGQLAYVWEELGDALVRLGEPVSGDEAFAVARRLVRGNAVREARLLHRHAQVAERSGRTTSAVRWARRALNVLEGLEGRQADGCRACVYGVFASARQRQGRSGEAIALCQQAIAEAERCGDELALAHACRTLDWALVTLGRTAEATHSSRALEIYERHGEVELRSHVLNNLGGFAYLAGRWDEAVRHYVGAARDSERAGDVSGAAFADCNIGEVLADQGHYEEAELRLRDALRLWRATDDEEGSAFARLLLGHLTVRTGKPEEGLRMLRAAGTELTRLRVADNAALAQALAAEAAVHAGRVDDAFAAIAELQPAAGRTAPVVHRAHAFALAAVGEPQATVAGALEASLRAARESECDYDAVVALDALCMLAPTFERERERDQLVARLGITRLPRPPLGSLVSGSADPVGSPGP